MATRRTNQQGQSVAPFIIIGALAVAGYGVYSGFPGLVMLWAGALIAAVAEPPAVFTGAKVGGYPTPAGPHEVAKQRDHAMAKDLAWRLVIPNPDWLPGWTPRAAWFAAVALGVLATLAPVTDPDTSPYWWIGPAGVVIAAWQVPASRRRTATPDDPNPGVRLGHLRAAGPLAWLTGTAGAVAAVALTAKILAVPVVAGAVDLRLPGPAYLAAAAVLGFVGGAWVKWRSAALETWRTMVATREEWEMRWSTALKLADAKPYLIGHREVGRLTVDTFAAPGTLGAAGVIALGPKFLQAVGSGVDATVLNMPATDANGQPMPGTAHPLNFEVVTFPAGSVPDISDPVTTAEEAGYLVTTALARAIDSYGQGGARMNLIDVTPMHVVPAAAEEAPGLLGRLLGKVRRRGDDETTAAPDADAAADVDELDETDDDAGEETAEAAAEDAAPQTQAAWQLRYQGVAGSAVWVRASYMSMMSERLGVEVLADDREADSVYAGALTSGETVFADGEQTGVYLEQLAKEDAWNSRWEMVLKQGANPPQPQFAVTRTARMGPVTLHSQPFLTKQGLEPTEYQRLEPKLATTLAAAPFVSVTGFQAQGGKPGERHPQGFTVRWSEGPVPTSADRIAPSDASRSNQGTAGTPQHWVLAGQVNAAFDHARLPRPEVMSARPMTVPKSRGHIWRIEVRLFGGVTIAHLRSNLAKITTSMGVPWLRVAPGRDPQTAVLVAGVSFRKAQLLNKREEPYLVDLDWQQAWADSGVHGVGGLLPQLTASGAMEKNPSVAILDFALPSGVGIDQIKESKALSKLKGATNNAFVQVLPGTAGAASVRLLVSEEDPMPKVAAVDFDAVDASSAIPFATGVDGEHIAYDWKDSPHLLVVGATGGGKSVSLQSLIYGALVRGSQLYVADPSKGGADFKFAVPWMTAFADTIEDTSVMLDAAYAEVIRRKNLNGRYGAGSYRELPAEVRPPHVVVVLDEFTSLIAKEKPRKPDSDDPEILRDYAETLAKNAAIDNIGSKVGRIAREARSAGFTLILATQRLTAAILEGLPGGADLRTNLARMILGKATFGELQSALKNPMAAPDLGEIVPPGRGMYEPMMGATQIIQSWYIDAMQDQLGAALAERRPPLGPDEKLDLEALRPVRRDLEVEGEIIPTGPRTAAPTQLVVVDAGSLELSLDDLEAFVDEADLEAEEAEEASGADPLTDDGIGDEPSELDRWLAQAEAAGEPDEEDELDWAGLTEPDSPDEADDDDDDDDDETAGGEDEPTPDAAAPPAGEPTTTALVLDVEGVITPLRASDDDGWGEASVIDAGLLGQVPVWPAMLAELGDGPWLRGWLSEWADGAGDTFGHLFDAAALAAPDGAWTGSWKVDALTAFLEHHPHVRTLVWVDGTSGEEGALGLSAAELAVESAASFGVDLVAVTPSGATLTPGDVARVRALLGANPQLPPAPVPEPTADRAPEPEPEPVPAATATPVDDEPFDELFASPVPSYRLPDPFAD